MFGLARTLTDLLSGSNDGVHRSAYAIHATDVNETHSPVDGDDSVEYAQA